MTQASEEWLRQSDYDFATARTMQEAGRRFYAVFFCHLSIEKALKGLYSGRTGRRPHRTHNLLFLARRAGLELPPSRSEFLFELNRASVLTRYPEDMETLERQFDAARTQAIVDQTAETLEWLGTQLKNQ